MQKYNVHIEATAEQDLDEIIIYIATVLNEPENALCIYSGLKGAIQTLQELPGRNRLLDEPEYATLGVRRLFVGNYVIFYAWLEPSKIVDVLRILYIRREWRSVLHFPDMENHEES